MSILDLEIIVLEKFPVILTKQKWESKTIAKAGAIIVLPSDAVLVLAPDNEDKKS